MVQGLCTCTNYQIISDLWTACRWTYSWFYKPGYIFTIARVLIINVPCVLSLKADEKHLIRYHWSARSAPYVSSCPHPHPPWDLVLTYSNCKMYNTTTPTVPWVDPTIIIQVFFNKNTNSEHIDRLLSIQRTTFSVEWSPAVFANMSDHQSQDSPSKTALGQ